MQSDIVGSTERLALMSALNRARTLEERIESQSERLRAADAAYQRLRRQLLEIRGTIDLHPKDGPERSSEGPSDSTGQTLAGDRVVRGQTDEGQPSGPGREAQVCPHCGAAY